MSDRRQSVRRRLEGRRYDAKKSAKGSSLCSAMEEGPINIAMEAEALFDSITCPVCKERYGGSSHEHMDSADGEQASRLPIQSAVCSHNMCSSCLKWYLTTSSQGRRVKSSAKKCPLCRKDKAFTKDGNVNYDLCDLADLVQRQEQSAAMESASANPTPLDASPSRASADSANVATDAGSGTQTLGKRPPPAAPKPKASSAGRPAQRPKVSRKRGASKKKAWVPSRAETVDHNVADGRPVRNRSKSRTITDEWNADHQLKLAAQEMVPDWDVLSHDSPSSVMRYEEQADFDPAHSSEDAAPNSVAQGSFHIASSFSEASAQFATATCSALVTPFKTFGIVPGSSSTKDQPSLKSESGGLNEGPRQSVLDTVTPRPAEHDLHDLEATEVGLARRPATLGAVSSSHSESESKKPAAATVEWQAHPLPDRAAINSMEVNIHASESANCDALSSSTSESASKRQLKAAVGMYAPATATSPGQPRPPAEGIDPSSYCSIDNGDDQSGMKIDGPSEVFSSVSRPSRPSTGSPGRRAVSRTLKSSGLFSTHVHPAAKSLVETFNLCPMSSRKSSDVPNPSSAAGTNTASTDVVPATLGPVRAHERTKTSEFDAGYPPTIPRTPPNTSLQGLRPPALSADPLSDPPLIGPQPTSDRSTVLEIEESLIGAASRAEVLSSPLMLPQGGLSPGRAPSPTMLVAAGLLQLKGARTAPFEEVNACTQTRDLSQVVTTIQINSSPSIHAMPAPFPVPSPSQREPPVVAPHQKVSQSVPLSRPPSSLMSLSTKSLDQTRAPPFDGAEPSSGFPPVSSPLPQQCFSFRPPSPLPSMPPSELQPPGQPSPPPLTLSSGDQDDIDDSLRQKQVTHRADEEVASIGADSRSSGKRCRLTPSPDVDLLGSKTCSLDDDVSVIDLTGDDSFDFDDVSVIDLTGDDDEDED